MSAPKEISKEFEELNDFVKYLGEGQPLFLEPFLKSDKVIWPEDKELKELAEGIICGMDYSGKRWAYAGDIAEADGMSIEQIKPVLEQTKIKTSEGEQLVFRVINQVYEFEVSHSFWKAFEEYYHQK